MGETTRSISFGYELDASPNPLVEASRWLVVSHRGSPSAAIDLMSASYHMSKMNGIDSSSIDTIAVRFGRVHWRWLLLEVEENDATFDDSRAMSMRTAL
jgi:hypothetical protein